MNSWPPTTTILNGYPHPPPTSGILLPNKTRVIIIYPTVDPHVVVVPIVSSIFVFPVIVFLIICWLRKMAAKRRQRARLAHRDDFWNERSCASIVQRSPPLSVSTIGNGYSGVGGLRGGAGTELEIELVTSVLDVEMAAVIASRHNHNHHNHSNNHLNTTTTTTTTNTQLSSSSNNAQVVDNVSHPSPDPDLGSLDEESKGGDLSSSISSS